MKSTKNKLLSSIATLCVCFAMLIGSTYAWFTDSASTGVNKIQAGNLDIEAYYQNAAPSGGDGTTPYTLPENSPRGTNINFKDATNPLDGATLIDESVKFEPGYVGAKLVTVKNVGNLAAKIKLQFAVRDNGLADQIWYDFMQVTKNANNQNEVTGNYDPNRVLTNPDINRFASRYEMPLLAGNEYQFIFMYGMKETAGNEYQGKSVDLSVTVLAKQMTEESDSFNDQYDKDAEYDPTIWDGTVATNGVTPNAEGIYEINTAAELAWVAQEVNVNNNTFSGKTIKLMKDINLANMPWTPIGSLVSYPSKAFAGTFDGNNHVISNLFIKDNTTLHASAGLFGGALGNAIIKNLEISNAVVYSTNYASVIVGYVTDGENVKIENCIVKDAKVVTEPELVDPSTGNYDNGAKDGVITGYGMGASINNCNVYSSSVKAFRDAGVLAGYAKSGSVTNSSFDQLSNAQPIIWDSNKIYDNGSQTVGENINNSAIGRAAQ